MLALLTLLVAVLSILGSNARVEMATFWAIISVVLQVWR